MDNLGLNENLLKINEHESGLCENCASTRIVQHFLISCPKFIIARALMLAETETHEDDILSLLNSSVSSHQKALVNFVVRSQRFSYL